MDAAANANWPAMPAVGQFVPLPIARRRCVAPPRRAIKRRDYATAFSDPGVLAAAEPVAPVPVAAPDAVTAWDEWWP